MVKANDFHHLAISTADTKRQLEFFSDVVGLELIALFPMHNVKGAFHCFLKLNDKACLSFVQLSQNANIEPVAGVTYAGGAGEGAPGSIQHLALNVDSELELLNMRDRVRSKGIHVIGPLDHGIMRSIYFAGPDHLSLEVSTWMREVIPDAWIDPEVAKALDISEEELVSLRNPVPYKGEGGAVAQPAVDPIKHHALFEDEITKVAIEMSDEEVFEKLSTPNDPVSL
ncbi:MAG: VOC family protein [Cyanothece sp. SIO1E1]|nr:VOC family protein [Cyanothece sp. SIO1E1]